MSSTRYPTFLERNEEALQDLVKRQADEIAALKANLEDGKRREFELESRIRELEAHSRVLPFEKTA